MSASHPLLRVPTPEHVNQTLASFHELRDRLDRMILDLRTAYNPAPSFVEETIEDLTRQRRGIEEMCVGLTRIFPEATPLRPDFTPRRRSWTRRRAAVVSPEPSTQPH